MHHEQAEFIQRFQHCLNKWDSISATHHSNMIRRKPTWYYQYAEKFEKNPTLNKLWVESNFHSLIKGIYQKQINKTNIILILKGWMLCPYYQEKARTSFPTTPNFCNKARKRNLERERLNSSCLQLTWFLL